MKKNNTQTYDLVIIGGGVNGCGIANDAAGRGLNVLLCEKEDLASATSSNSSKLIHGGLRYLEQYEFKLVRKALLERETLLKNAPHIIWPLRFRLPHRPHLRPKWMILAGLFLYDNLAKRVTLGKSNKVSLRDKSPLIDEITDAFEYSDAWVDDARLVTLNAVSAKNNGATIKTQTTCTKAIRKGDAWQVDLLNQTTGLVEIVKAKMLVNAGGPWVSDLFDEAIEVPRPRNIRLIKGSHIVTPKLYDEDHAFILQNEDGRIVFVIPYEDDFSLIGTTDVEVDEDPSSVKISDEETDYLIEVINSHYKKSIQRSDVIHSYAGVRPLMDDESSSAQEITRDYTLELNNDAGKAPLLSIFGGKITTYRTLSEDAVNKIADFFPSIGSSWTKNTVLPGGNFSNHAHLLKKFQQQYSSLPVELLRRYVRSYGTLTHTILNGCDTTEDLGTHFGSGLYEQEVRYLIEQEWAMTSDDILWRRTKLGLRLNTEQKQELSEFMQSYFAKKNAFVEEINTSRKAS